MDHLQALPQYWHCQYSSYSPIQSPWHHPGASLPSLLPYPFPPAA